MKRILFVDDEANVLQGLQRMLRPLRHEWDMHFSDSGKNAIEMMEQAEPFDVVVSDMRMPGMDGTQFLSIVMERWPSAVRMVLTGHTDNETVFRAAGISHQFLSKPCQADTLKNVIEGAFALREYLSNDRLKQLLSRINTIPSIPDLYLQLLRELRKPDPALKDIADIIEQDFGMCAKLLHFVNSAHFGLVNPISSPLQAINYIGLSNLRSLILGVEIFSSLDATRLPAGFSMTQLWQHSLRVAAFARIIAKTEKLDPKLVDESYMAGLLHDSGTLVLASNMPELYQLVLKQMREKKVPLEDAEAAILGASHAEVGAYLLALWGLPDTIVEAVAYHQKPSLSLAQTFTPLAVVHIADALHRELDPHTDMEASPLDVPFLMHLGLHDHLPLWRAACQQSLSGSPSSSGS